MLPRSIAVLFANLAAASSNFVHFHDRAGGTTSVVLGYLFMLAGSRLLTAILANEPPRWRIRSAKVRQTSSGRSDVGKHRMNQGGPSIVRKMVVLAILAPIILAAGVLGLLWCTSLETPPLRRFGGPSRARSDRYCRGDLLVPSPG